MSKGHSYYLLSVLLVIVTAAICLFIAGRLSPNVSEFSNCLVNVMYRALVVLCLVQTGALLISCYSRLYPRFFIAFTGTCAIMFLMIYILIVYSKLKDWESLRGIMENAHELEGLDLKSCFIGDHNWFLVPAALQVLMVVLLRRQQKQAASKAVG